MRKSAYVFIGLFLTACVNCGRLPPYTQNDNTKVIALINSISDSLGDFNSNGGMTYAMRNPCLGYSKRYVTLRAPVFIDVYAYNMCIDARPDGIDSELFASLYRQNVESIKSYYNGYKDRFVQEVRDELVTYRGIKFKHAKFFIVGDNNEIGGMESSMFLTIYNNSILKVRASYLPLTTSDGGGKLLTDFMKALTADIAGVKE